MPPKKGGGGTKGGGKGGKGGGGGQKAVKVGLDRKGQEQILAVVQQQGGGGSKKVVAAEHLDKKSFAKKLDELYDKLLSIGFSPPQIERALRATSLNGDAEGRLSLELVLDWMCLNLPAEELPAAFADPTSRQLKQGRVSVVFAGNGTSRPDAALAEREFAVAPLEGWESKVLDEGEGEDSEERHKEWIRAYMEQQAEEEAAARRAAKSQVSIEQRWAAMTPEEKLKCLEASYEEEKEKARLAKESGKQGRREKAEMEARLKDIRDQIQELRVVVGQKKREMKRLKDELLADMIKSAAAAPTVVEAEKKPVLDAGDGNGAGAADFGSMFDDDDDGEEEVEQVPEKPRKEPLKASPSPPIPPQGSGMISEQSVVKGLFGDDDDEEDEGVPPKPVRARPSKKPPNRSQPLTQPLVEGGPALPPPSSEPPSAPLEPNPVVEEAAAPPPPPNKNLPGVPRNWTGKTPKKQLEEYLQKQKLGRPIFQKGYDNSCTLILKLAGGEKRFESVGEFEGHGDAQHAAATRALYDLLPNMPIYRVLPPPFRDWWQDWAAEAKAKKDAEVAAVKKGKKDRIQNLVQSIKTEHESLLAQGGEEGEAASTTTTGPGEGGAVKPVVLPVLDGDNWEDLADHLEENQASKGEEEEKERNKVGEVLKKRFERIKSSSAWQEMYRTRLGLPVAESRQEILDCIRRERVVVVSGETGCGKSTQVAQYILEEALEKGEAHKVNIVCTQPRRVAAMSLAERVAEEMGEDKAGTSDGLVGYQIRMESHASASTRLLFCTTGILLRRLQSDPQLASYTHIILDEVHERQALGDFLLIVLRDLLAVREDLKVVLMSATVNADLFSRYFGGCPTFSIPGRTFPVTDFFLEDAIHLTGHVIEEGSQCALRGSGPNMRRAAVNVSGRGGKTYTQQLYWEDEGGDEAEDPKWTEYMDHVRAKGLSVVAMKSLARVDESTVNYDLVEDLLKQLLDKEEAQQGGASTIPGGGLGAILIFLPGIGEIRTLYERLTVSRVFGDQSRYLVLPLHSSLSSKEQQRVFDRPPRGARKIILSTNIAETSVTIDDVFYVIDTGLVREIQLANRARGGARALVSTWCCRASAKQRTGRAGRVGPGVCYRLFSSYTYHNVMREFAVPELQRVPLEELCLQVRANGLADSARSFLLRAPQPPAEDAIDRAITVLEDVGALAKVPPPPSSGLKPEKRPEGAVTALGRHLVKLPLDVRLGKMLIFGAMFRCLDPILSITASLSCKSPFVTPFGREQEAKSMHSRFEVRQSDFLSLHRVFQAYRDVSKKGSGAEYRFCNEYYLSRMTLREIQDLKVQYLSLLMDIGFAPRDGVSSGWGNDYDKLEAWMGRQSTSSGGANSQSDNTNLVLAVVCAGLYPNVAKVQQDRLAGTKPLFYHGPPCDGNAVCLHGSSMCSTLKYFSSPWVIFHEKFYTVRAYISPTSAVTPYALLLFGGDLVVDHLQNRVTIDQWIDFHVPARTAVLFREMRKKLNEILEVLIERPLLISQGGGSSSSTSGGSEEKPFHEVVVDTIVGLLSAEDVKAAWVPGSEDDPDMKK